VSSVDPGSTNPSFTSQTSSATSTGSSGAGSTSQTQPAPASPDQERVESHELLSRILHGHLSGGLGVERYWDGTDTVGTTLTEIEPAVKAAIPGDRPKRRPAVSLGHQRGI
jgi:hypothetical protein